MGFGILPRGHIIYYVHRVTVCFTGRSEPRQPVLIMSPRVPSQLGQLPSQPEFSSFDLESVIEAHGKLCGCVRAFSLSLKSFRFTIYHCASFLQQRGIDTFYVPGD